MTRITKEDSRELGFVFPCLFKQAITLEEMKKWCYEVIRSHDEYPDYILDIIDFSGAIAHLYKTVGFSPHWPFAEEDKLALYGIAYKRGRDMYDCPISKKQALEELRRRPVIEKYFKEIFPFISLT